MENLSGTEFFFPARISPLVTCDGEPSWAKWRNWCCSMARASSTSHVAQARGCEVLQRTASPTRVCHGPSARRPGVANLRVGLRKNADRRSDPRQSREHNPASRTPPASLWPCSPLAFPLPQPLTPTSSSDYRLGMSGRLSLLLNLDLGLLANGLSGFLVDA